MIPQEVRDFIRQEIRAAFAELATVEGRKQELKSLSDSNGWQLEPSHIETVANLPGKQVYDDAVKVMRMKYGRKAGNRVTGPVVYSGQADPATVKRAVALAQSTGKSFSEALRSLA